MCGRFSLSAAEDDILAHFNVPERMEGYQPRYNISPGQYIWAVTNDGSQNTIRKFKWGLVPFWSKSTKSAYSMLNAKAETIASKPAFREPFKRSRTLIISNGFYEWQKISEKEKQPMRIGLKDSSVFGLAGLWDSWTAEDGNVLETCTIITCEPNSLMKPIHDRMPVLIGKENEQSWLDPGIKDPAILESFLTPYPSDEMNAYPVSKIVGNVKNDVPECIVSL
jgi:putative SOS response-associated peptidase YedK